MSALFDFNAFLTVVLLTVCTCTYIKLKAPAVLAQKTGCAPCCRSASPIPSVQRVAGQLCTEYWPPKPALTEAPHALIIRFRGFFWKAARVGERLSPWVGLGCFVMGLVVLFM